MSPRAWVAFERRGGMPPADDETLAVDEHGGFTARRTIGGTTIGAFQGRLAAGPLARLAKAVDGLEGVEDVTIPTPRHGATETLSAADRTLQLPATARPPVPWRRLLEPVRTLFEADVIAQPRAAVRLVATATAGRLEHAGTEPIDVDMGTLTIRVVHMSGDDAVRGQWHGRPTDTLVDNGETLVAKPAWVTATPGWTAPLPFDHGFRLAAGEWLQVWVDLAIRADGARRAGQLYAPVIPDA